MRRSDRLIASARRLAERTLLPPQVCVAYLTGGEREMAAAHYGYDTVLRCEAAPDWAQRQAEQYDRWLGVGSWRWTSRLADAGGERARLWVGPAEAEAA